MRPVGRHVLRDGVSGGTHFLGPIHVGELVELNALLSDRPHQPGRVAGRVRQRSETQRAPADGTLCRRIRRVGYSTGPLPVQPGSRWTRLTWLSNPMPKRLADLRQQWTARWNSDLAFSATTRESPTLVNGARASAVTKLLARQRSGMSRLRYGPSVPPPSIHQRYVASR